MSEQKPIASSSSSCRHPDTNFRKDPLGRLSEKQAEELDATIKHIELYSKYNDDYKELKSLINRMQDKVKHKHRIPVAGTKLAFVDGHIIHTNEFHVLLGDNYFALRSGRQANQIIDRRLEDINGKLKSCKDAKKKIEDWFKVTEEYKRDKEEFVEIIETI